MIGDVNMDDLITTSENLPDKSEDILLAPQNGKVLYISKSTEGINLRSLLDQVAQYVNMADVIGKIKAGTQYVVQIPTEHQAAFQAGENFLMQNKESGKLWPTLMKVAENGRNEVVTPLPINEQSFVQDNPIQDLAQGFHSAIIQQQMAQLTLLVEETYRVVERIEHGQMDDRIGLLIAGKNGISLALSMPEGAERNMQIVSSRQSLLTAQAQIGKTLERRATEFAPLSKHAVVRFAHEFIRGGYLQSKDREFEEIQEYYELYLHATKLIAATYVLCSDTPTAEKMFELGAQFLSSIDFSRIKTIEYSHRPLKDMFYLKPVEYLEAERTACVNVAKRYDYFALEVSGAALLEAISDGESETISEEGT